MKNVKIFSIKDQKAINEFMKDKNIYDVKINEKYALVIYEMIEPKKSAKMDSFENIGKKLVSGFS
jgi:hypothetical protein